MTAAITQPAAFIAMLAGDPATAQFHLRLEYESLSLMGEKYSLPPRQRYSPSHSDARSNAVR